MAFHKNKNSLSYFCCFLLPPTTIFGCITSFITRSVAIGVKFAPSLENLSMAKLEEDIVYAHCRSELLLWARYIDDILQVWNGSHQFFGSGDYGSGSEVDYLRSF